MNTDQSQKPADVSPCGCSPAELKWCLRWIQDHGAPCEWTAATEQEYKAALDAFRAAVAA